MQAFTQAYAPQTHALMRSPVLSNWWAARS
jgi:hypothetical protein